ncbi:MAG: Trehalose utilization [Lentisphaerae bacterium ADurb.BinA184]|nr:MAG: Trehalose utilization [Lentisphaerae bacterium ADurb.BinA184]
MLNVLLLRHSAGFEHSYLPHAEVTVKELGQESGLFTATTTHACGRITAETLAKTDVLIFATTGELPFSDEQKTAILDFVRGGKGFVGIHNAADTCYKWAEYGELVGGYFNGHPWSQHVWVNVEDNNHPATRHLGRGVLMIEEVYTFKSWDRAKTRVLMSLDKGSIDVSKGNRADHDYAMAWCHPYGKGRSMYTGLGHYDEVWRLPWFRQHILGCIKWAAGIEG